jgi:hypothetical protein
MTQALAKTRNTEIAALAPNQELARFASSLTCWTPSNPLEKLGLIRSLTGAEREQIRDRVEQLRAAIEARDPRATQRAIAGMMLSYPSGRASGDEAAAVVAAYVNALSDLPPWAITEAVNRFIRGHVPAANAAFAPSGAEIHQEARKVVTPLLAELRTLDRLLEGETMQDIGRKLSRERSTQIEDMRVRAVSDAALRQRLREMGKTGEEINAAMREVDEEKVRQSSAFERIPASLKRTPEAA